MPCNVYSKIMQIMGKPVSGDPYHGTIEAAVGLVTRPHHSNCNVHRALLEALLMEHRLSDLVVKEVVRR